MVTKVESFVGTTESNKSYAMGIGEGGVERRGAATPRMRRGDNQSGFSSDMMEVWANVASLIFRPEGPPHQPLSRNAPPRSNSTDSPTNSLAPTICTSIRCTVPACTCECFLPGKMHLRYCDTCNHGWVPHALDKLGFRHVFGQSPVEPVQANVAFDIASLVLYGCQALPIRLKILLDRLFSVLQRDEVLQILRGFGWTHEDYARGYILQEPHGPVLDRWNICSPEEEPLVLQQFLRFGETRAITQQLLLHGLSDMRQFPRMEADIKKLIEKASRNNNNNTTSEKPKAHEEEQESSKDRLSIKPVPLQNLQSSKSPNSLKNEQLPRRSPQQPSPVSFVKLPPTGLTCTPATSVSPPSSMVGSPISVSPLNKLQNMQPFDFRKIANEIPERRRHSDTRSPPSLNRSVPSPSPSMILPPPPPPPLERPPQKSPSADFHSFAGSSEFDSEEDYDNEENSQSALNLSKDFVPKQSRQPRERSGPGRKSSMKRNWGANLPPNLGIQLINPATGKKRVQCNVCLKTFCDKGALKIHYSAVHLREMHKCTVDGCNMMFSSRRSRNRHSANPNPKLHSPHLRRKISPHDGRSSHAHPILIPPLQGGLNPLTFGNFPLLTPPPDMLHHAQSMDLKTMDLSLKQYQQYHEEQKMMMENSSDDYNMDDEDEEGIVIDGGEDYDDKYFPDNGEKSEDMKIKSDSEEDGVDSNDDSISLADSQGVKEEKVQNMNNRGRKRKSMNPTRISSKQISDDNRVKESDDDVEEEDSKDENRRNDYRIHNSEGEGKKIKVEVDQEDKKESNNNEHIERNETDNINKESAETMNALKHLEHISNANNDKIKKYIVPETSDHSDGSEDSDDPENKIFGHFENGNTFVSSSDIPIDTDNPLRCLSCTETFESHFVLKTHYQKEHLKLMHKCVIKGCNAAFHSKRSRDRHSSNSNLHRKLLSTNVAHETSMNNNGIINPLFLENLQLQQQNLSQIQNLAQLQQGGPNNPLFHNEFLTRLYAEQLSNFSNGHLNLFQQHQAAGFPGFPLQNGLTSRPSRGRESRSSRESSSPSLHPVYNVDEDLGNSTEYPLQCRFCNQSINSKNEATSHFEHLHLSEMFKCHNSNCSLVFSSRTKRNIHQEQEKQLRNSSTASS
uniref:Zinc finger protein basonuclin-2 n=1 Tax=Cacopsylla melanoneura TaxID=428564 RepID=A0A8D9DVX8_9HEMI